MRPKANCHRKSANAGVLPVQRVSCEVSGMANPLSNPARRAGGGCLLLFGMVFVLAGLAVGYFAYFPAVLGWWEARSWQEVPCWIEQVGMRESHDSDDGSTTYAVEARYRYVFAGRTYHGDRVSLVGGSDNLGDFHQRVHDELRGYEGKEKPFRCLVNPQKPEESLLYAELRWGLLLLLALFPLLFPLVGGLVGIGGMVSARKAARVAELRARHPEEPWKWKGEWAGEGIRPAADGVAAGGAGCPVAAGGAGAPGGGCGDEWRDRTDLGCLVANPGAGQPLAPATGHSAPVADACRDWRGAVSA